MRGKRLKSVSARGAFLPPRLPPPCAPVGRCPHSGARCALCRSCWRVSAALRLGCAVAFMRHALACGSGPPRGPPPRAVSPGGVPRPFLARPRSLRSRPSGSGESGWGAPWAHIRVFRLSRCSLFLSLCLPKKPLSLWALSSPIFLGTLTAERKIEVWPPIPHAVIQDRIGTTRELPSITSLETTLGGASPTLHPRGGLHPPCPLPPKNQLR